MIFYIFVALVSPAFGAVFYPGPCPIIASMENFNITAYGSGTWYEIARYPTDWEYRGGCVVLNFYTENGVIKYKLSDVVEHHVYSLQGILERASSAGNTGLLNFISTAYKESEGDTVVPVNLYTDYVSYVVGVNCKYDQKSNIHHDFVWMMSRTKSFDDKTKKAVDNIINTLGFVDKSKFIWIDYSKDSCDGS